MCGGSPLTWLLLQFELETDAVLNNLAAPEVAARDER